jgi:hypothetical protein
MIYVQRLNLDNSYLIEISGWKVLIDPWLEGSEIDYFPWFNKQWHRTPPIAYSALENFDTVLITQKYPDHFHAETLKKLQAKRIIAPKSLKKKLLKLLPHASIFFMDEKNDRLEEKGVQVTFFPTKRKIDPIYDAFLLDDGKESIFVAPHGFLANDKEVDLLRSASPCKLLITPFNYYKLPFFLGGVVSPGIDGVKHLCDVLDPEKVISSHDEDKHAEGLVSKFAKIIRPSSQESLHKLPWLAGRYQEITDYNRIQVS